MMKVFVSLLALCFLFSTVNADCTSALLSSSNSNFTDLLAAPYLWSNQSSLVPSPSGGLLTLVVHSHLYYKNITIQFDAEVNQSGNHSTACDYFLGQTGNLNWTQGVEGADNCGVNFTGKFDIRTVLRQCFHKLETNAVFDVYETNIRLTTVFARNGSRGETNVDRVYVTANKLRIQFPRNINVTLAPNTEGKNLTTFGTNIIFGDVILQQFEQDSYNTRIHFYTTVNPPYMLNATTQSVIPADQYKFNQNLTLLPRAQFTCANDNTSICAELWEVLVAPTQGQCRIDATVTLNFTVFCRPTFGGGCNASLLTPPTYSVTFRLLSNDFCPQLINDGVITGNIYSYSDSSLQTPQANFLYNQQLHFKIHIDKAFGPNIITTSINSVTVSSFADVVFNPSAASSVPSNAYVGAQFDFHNTHINPDEAYFTFKAGRFSITFADTDKSQLVNVTASVTVTYEQLTSGMQMQSVVPVRFALQADSSSGEVTTTATIAPPSSDDASSSAASGALIIPVAAAVGGFVAVTALVLFLRKRRSQDAASSATDEPKMLFV